MKGEPILPAVQMLIEAAHARRVLAAYVPLETYDTFMLRLWRNIEGKGDGLDAKVRKGRRTAVTIPLYPAGSRKPILRLNALPIVTMPKKCFSLSFSKSKEWSDLREARDNASYEIFLTKGEQIWAWGSRDKIKEVFGGDLRALSEVEFMTDYTLPQNLHLKGFAEQALSAAIARGKPLLSRKARDTSFLIIDAQATDRSATDQLARLVGKPSGTITGLFTEITEEFPQPEKVSWAEAARISIDVRDGRLWALVDPDIWIWPQRARKIATEFMDKRREDRFNDKYNALLNVWVALVTGTREQNTEVTVSALDHGIGAENPTFILGSRTAFSWRLSA